MSSDRVARGHICGAPHPVHDEHGACAEWGLSRDRPEQMLGQHAHGRLVTHDHHPPGVWRVIAGHLEQLFHPRRKGNLRVRRDGRVDAQRARQDLRGLHGPDQRATDDGVYGLWLLHEEATRAPDIAPALGGQAAQLVRHGGARLAMSYQYQGHRSAHVVSIAGPGVPRILCADMTLPEHCRSIITGAGSGLGRALAMELAGRGAHILVADVDEAGGAETVKMLRDAGAQAHFQVCDVRDAAQVEALSDVADQHMGGVDLLVNNAGVAVTGRVGEVTLQDWRFIVDVNLMGVVHGCHTFVPKMVAQRGGFILNVASAAGLLAPPEMAPYNVTKAAVVAMSETLRAEVATENVVVSVLCPTFFRTNLMDAARSPGKHQNMAVKMMDKSKIQASDVARAALDALDTDKLYVIPMLDGRMLWGLKRWMPGGYAGTVAWLTKRNLLPR